MMKKLIISLVSLFVLTVSANAMSYNQARRQALFLTDKMAYELNLTDDQYEAAYEINLDYLMSIDNYDDLYGLYWERRNLDLSYILLDWQYRMYRDASYFYRPLYWNAGYWHFGVYARYPYRDYFYFGTPRFYAVYRGGHSWHRNGNRSWYYGRDYGPRRGYDEIGMRDGFNRGYYNNGSRSFGNGPRRIISTYDSPSRSNGGGDYRRYNAAPNRSSGSFGNRQSSTRTTVTQPGSFGNGSRSGGSFGRDESTGVRSTVPNRTFTPDPSTPSRSSSPSRSYSSPSRSYSPPSRSYSSPSRSYSSPSRSYSPPSRSYSVPSRSYSSPSRSYSSPSRSGGNSTGTQGGGRSFGGRR